MVTVVEYEVTGIQLVTVNSIIQFKNKEECVGFFTMVEDVNCEDDEKESSPQYLVGYYTAIDKVVYIFGEENRVFCYPL